MEALDTLLVDKNSTNLTAGTLQLSVQVLDSGKNIPANLLTVHASHQMSRLQRGD
jgi:hypothetical protein